MVGKKEGGTIARWLGRKREERGRNYSEMVGKKEKGTMMKRDNGQVLVREEVKEGGENIRK